MVGIGRSAARMSAALSVCCTPHEGTKTWLGVRVRVGVGVRVGVRVRVRGTGKGRGRG